jgi:hypothetical protein
LTARRFKFGTCARLLGRAVAQAGGRAAWFFGKTLVFGFFVGIWYRTRRVRIERLQNYHEPFGNVILEVRDDPDFVISPF